MKRLTVKRADGRWAIGNYDRASPLEQINKLPFAIDRLAAYEDTGLTPEEIKKIYGILAEVSDRYNLRFDFVVKCLTEKASEASNNPLTLDELREMVGEPYWHVGLQKDSPPPHYTILPHHIAEHLEDYHYGEYWLAYRRKWSSQ